MSPFLMYSTSRPTWTTPPVISCPRTGHCGAVVRPSSLVDEVRVPPHYEQFSRYFMTKHPTLWGCRPASHHMLITSADVRCDIFNNYPVLTFPPNVLTMNTWSVP